MKKYVGMFRVQSAETGVAVEVLLAVANVESAFDPDAVSNVGAVGLMQVMPATARWMAQREGWAYEDALLRDPAYNLRAGATYLAYLATKFEGDWILAAYNAGEGVVERWIADGVRIEDIPYKETREYLSKVRKLTKAYRRRGFSG